MAIGLVLMPLLRADAGQAQESAPSQFGFVVDESGGAVAGALLTVRTAHGAPRQNTATAGDGSFAFRGLPPGSYWLEVTAHPFQQQRLRLELDGTEVEPLRIVLGLAPFQSEVTVTAERGTMTDVDGAAGHSRRPLWPPPERRWHRFAIACCRSVPLCCQNVLHSRTCRIVQQTRAHSSRPTSGGPEETAVVC